MPQQAYLECASHLMFYHTAIKPVQSLLPRSSLMYSPFRGTIILNLLGYHECYEVKYTIENPIQLPTTPIAEYELVNISGMNSYFFPKTSSWMREQYRIRGMETAMYSKENLSSRNTRGREDTGARRSKTWRNSMSQRMVYTVLTGNSAAVKINGNRDTCPATANGRNAPRNRRSFSARRLKGIMTRRMAFSWTCHPNKKEA